MPAAETAAAGITTVLRVVSCRRRQLANSAPYSRQSDRCWSSTDA